MVRYRPYNEDSNGSIDYCEECNSNNTISTIVSTVCLSCNHVKHK